MPSAQRDLRRRIRAEQKSNRVDTVPELRQGVVTAVNTGPSPTVDIRLGDSSVVIPAVHRMANYTPSVGDTIWAFVTGPDILVLGRQA